MGANHFRLRHGDPGRGTRPVGGFPGRQLEWSMIMRSEGGVGDETLHSRFEHIAGTDPTQIAVVAGNDALTYGELNERSNRVAWRLRDLGVGRGTLVGLRVDRCSQGRVGNP